MSSYRKKRRPPGTERTEQQNLLTETQYANPGVQRDLSSNQLTSGLPYQRPVEPEDVDRLIAKWDDRLLTPLVASGTASLTWWTGSTGSPPCGRWQTAAM